MKRSVPPRKGTSSMFDSEIIDSSTDIISVRVIYTDFRTPPSISDSLAAVEWAAIWEVAQKYYESRGEKLKFPKNGPDGPPSSSRQRNFPSTSGKH